MNNMKRNFFTNIIFDISLFRVVYLVSLFFCSFCYTEVIANIIKYSLLFWGFVLIYFYCIRLRRFYNIMYVQWLIGFILSALITSFLHILDNFFLNIVLLCHVAVCFFLLYGMHTEKNKKRKYRELYIISNFVLITTTVTMIISFISLIFGQQNFNFMGNKYTMVIFENRFTGIFTNPNLLAFYGVVAIVFADILNKDNLYSESGISRKFPRWFLIVCSFINAIGIFLSDSNGSLLLLTCYIIGNLIYILFGCFKNINLKNLIFGVSFSLIIAVMLVGCLLGLRICSNKAVSVALSAGNAISQSNSVNPLNKKDFPSSEVEKDNLTQEKKDEISIVTFAHENDNLDSGRIKLLQKAIVVFYNNPIFGVGKENIILYGKRLLEKGFKYSDLHNGYLTILVSNGLIGFILFIGFAISIGKHCLKSLFLEKVNLRKSPFLCLFAFLFAYCVYSLIEKTLLLEHTYMVVIFWYFLGYTSCYIQKYNHINDKFNFKSIFNNKYSNQSDDVSDITDTFAD